MKYTPIILSFIILSCSHMPQNKNTYAYASLFLQKHTNKLIELSTPDHQSKLLLSPDYQGRVMTSTASGDSGRSFGWINYDLIASPQKKKQFNPVGGEERFWLGPEGGQFSLYFKAGDTFNLAHWQVPPFIDITPFPGEAIAPDRAVFAQRASLTNYSGTPLEIGIEREVRLLNKTDLEQKLQTTIPANIKFVAFESTNTLSNLGNADWSRQTGLPSIWLLGMFTPSPQTTVIIPFNGIPNAASHITSDYFGPVPPERLQIRDSILYFTADGKHRSKIGLSPSIAKPIAASFDAANNILTIILPQVDSTAPYVNSKWELQKEPFKGDVINSYNDGPLPDGTQLGPFYEIESSSPALELKKGQKGAYRQTTCHFVGDMDALKQLAKTLLGVDLKDMTSSRLSH